MQRVFLIAAAAVFCLAAAPHATAQNVPGPADAGRAQQRLQDRNISAPTSPVRMMPVQRIPGAVMPENAADLHFTLQNITLKGSTVYTAAQVSEWTENLRGQNISLATVYALAQEWTARYRGDGYILSQVIVPPQTIESGTLVLQAVEGFIDSTTYPDDLSADNLALIRAYIAPAVTARPLRAIDLERALLLINDLPGMSVESILSPSDNTRGAAHLTLLSRFKSFDAFFDVNNRGSRYLGALQAQTALRLNNPLGFQESVTFQIATAPDGFPHRELDFASVQMDKPLNSNGTQLYTGASITSTDPGHTLQAFDIKGLARAFHIGIRHAWLRSRVHNFMTALQFDYLDSERTDNLGLGKTEDRLRVLRLSADWDYSDRFAGFNQANITFSKGIDVLNMKEKNTLNPTRTRGEPAFFKVAFDLARTQRLNHLFDLRVALSGQKSAHKLLASEEFGIGGAAFGSAYDSSEITGEDGIAARLELQTRAFENSAQMKPYAFYDIGKVWDADNTAANNRIRSIASAGIGARFRLGHHITGEAEAAKPLTRRVETVNDKDIRIFGRLSARF